MDTVRIDLLGQISEIAESPPPGFAQTFVTNQVMQTGTDFTFQFGSAKYRLRYGGPVNIRYSLKAGYYFDVFKTQP
jgi:hypothetical protein